MENNLLSTKVLFLDFDGPLHPAIAIEGIRIPPDEEACVDRNLFRWAIHLELILCALPSEQRESILIAAHSSWRKIQGLSQDLIRRQLGPNLARQYIGMTRPELPRWASIQDMCERGGFSDILILDDAVDEFPKDLPQLVACNPLKGLSDPLVQAKVRDWASSTAESESLNATQRAIKRAMTA
jgi:hypothetical protein